MIASTRFAILAALLAAAVVAVSAANATGGATVGLSIGDVTFSDVVAQLEKAESLVHAKMTAGWSWILDNFSHFVIAGPLTFVFHEVVYFGCWMPWLLLDKIKFFDKYRIQPEKRASGAMVWKCLKRLLFSHVFIQLPMQLLFHWVAKFLGFSMELPSLRFAISLGSSPRSS